MGRRFFQEHYCYTVVIYTRIHFSSSRKYFTSDYKTAHTDKAKITAARLEDTHYFPFANNYF